MRDEKGRYVKGTSGNPNGRGKRNREIAYYRIMETTVTPADWQAIVAKAVSQAKHGDSLARKWLSDYLVGTPPQRHELTGSDGDPLKVLVEYVNDPAPTTEVPSGPSTD